MPNLTPENLNFVEAGIGIMTAVIMADGKYSDEEFVWWKSMQNVHPLFRDVPPDVFNPMLRRVKEQLTAATPETIRPLIERWGSAVPQGYGPQMFELAADLATVDKNLSGKEPELLTNLWRALGVPEDKARQIVMSKLERM